MATICMWTREHYDRTDSGKSWKSKPSEVERFAISEDWQRNQTNDSAVSFWNACGTCRRQYGYTYAGYCVTHMTLTSPDRERQTREYFRFIPISLGYREYDIINAARTGSIRTEARGDGAHEIARFEVLDHFIEIDLTARTVVS